MSMHQAENVAPIALAERPVGRAQRRRLTARLEPFDSYWQAPADVDKGYAKFAAYYRANYLPHLPADRDARILVLSCGPGYLVSLLHAGRLPECHRRRFGPGEGRACQAALVAVRDRRGVPVPRAEPGSRSTSSSPSRS